MKGCINFKCTTHKGEMCNFCVQRCGKCKLERTCLDNPDNKPKTVLCPWSASCKNTGHFPICFADFEDDDKCSAYRPLEKEGIAHAQ